MTLTDHVSRLRALNAALLAALSVEPMERCSTLMAERGEVLAAFGAAHQTASAVDLATLQNEIIALRQEETRLQEQFQQALSGLGRQLSQPQQPRQSESPVDPFCIDRHA
ncbi:MAG: hypothetical protein ABIF77_20140 [bacterium]